jgi:hypothetical protein
MTPHYTDGDPARGCGLGLLIGCLVWVVVLVAAAVVVARL